MLCEIPKCCDVINKFCVLCKSEWSNPIKSVNYSPPVEAICLTFDGRCSLVRTNAVGILLQITSVRRGYGCWISVAQGLAIERIAEKDSWTHCSTWSNSLRLMPLRTSWSHTQQNNTKMRNYNHQSLHILGNKVE